MQPSSKCIIRKSLLQKNGVIGAPIILVQYPQDMSTLRTITPFQRGLSHRYRSLSYGGEWEA